MDNSNPSDELNRLIAEEWNVRLEEDPLLATQTGVNRYNDRLPERSIEAENRRAAQVEAFRVRLQAVEAESLSDADRLNFALFSMELDHQVQMRRFHAHLMPLSKLSGPHSILPDIIEMTPFHRVSDYQGN